MACLSEWHSAIRCGLLGWRVLTSQRCPCLRHGRRILLFSSRFQPLDSTRTTKNIKKSETRSEDSRNRRHDCVLKSNSPNHPYIQPASHPSIQPFIHLPFHTQRGEKGMKTRRKKFFLHRYLYIDYRIKNAIKLTLARLTCQTSADTIIPLPLKGHRHAGQVIYS